MSVTNLSFDELQREYDALGAEATKLAGGLNDLSQRATTYHHIYQHSGGNHIFPLIAAHGALWARDYFAFGGKLAKAMSLQFVFSPRKRRQKLRDLEDFTNAFREINRRVCIAIYTTYHFTARYGDHPDIDRFVRPELLTALRRIHSARLSGLDMSDEAKRELFLAHFLDEQEYVVRPSIDKAMAEFDWPILKFIAMKPRIQFAYFPQETDFRFRNFAEQNDRIEKGERAFEVAADVGWDQVELALRAYEILPEEFFADNETYFHGLRGAILASV